ncbi:MAG: methyltransferase domain-containing protein [Bdellovibrionales bacterium]|nr:methyltransferase domain-containing protein [Bdellovibrionales bacterium]
MHGPARKRRLAHAKTAKPVSSCTTVCYLARMNNSAPQQNHEYEEAFLTAVSQAGILHLERQQQIEDALFAVELENFFPDTQIPQVLANTSVEIVPQVLLPRLSQIVRVLSLLPLFKGARVLEIGCANGYTSALLQSLGAKVYALEPIGLLAQKARKSLDRTIYQSVIVKGGSTLLRWQEYAPFDFIVAWRSLKELPFSLVEDVVEGGKIVAPIDQNNSVNLFMWQLDPEIKVYRLEEFACGPYVVS